MGECHQSQISDSDALWNKRRYVIELLGPVILSECFLDDSNARVPVVGVDSTEIRSCLSFPCRRPKSQGERSTRLGLCVPVAPALGRQPIIPT